MKFKKFDKYTIIKKLTSGGMADILLAADANPSGFNRFVVIKRVLEKFYNNADFKNMFKNEGKIVCNLRHRNVISIYDFGSEKDQLFLSMEYISGRSLRDLVKSIKLEKVQLSIPNIVYVITSVAAGLDYVHNAIDVNTGKSLNLIHRDISPQNIMLGYDGDVKIIDFGISKIADINLTRAGHLKGKFSYMSPEQASGQVLNATTDIFCLGIILWELLTGKRLFASKDEMMTLSKVRNCDIPDAQKINPNIPTELNRIIKKTLSKNKDTRYQHSSSLEKDLNIFLNKNYPEHSHYNFISFMKKTYSKDIMKEREQLKAYSIKFMKYQSASSIIESFKNDNNLLNIPGVWDQEESTQIDSKSFDKNDFEHSKTLSNTVNTENVKKDTSFSKTHTNQNKTDKEDITLVPADDTTSLSTIEPNRIAIEESSIRTSLSKSLYPSQIFENINIKNYSSKRTLNISQKIHKTKKQVKKIGLGLRLIIALCAFVGFGLIVQMAFFSNHNFIHDIKNLLQNQNFIVDDSHDSKHKPINKTSRNIGQHKKSSLTNKNLAKDFVSVLINSNPSGADIFINGNLIAHTPSIIKIKSQKVKMILRKLDHLDKTVIWTRKQKKNTLHLILQPIRIKRQNLIQIIQ